MATNFLSETESPSPPVPMLDSALIDLSPLDISFDPILNDSGLDIAHKPDDLDTEDTASLSSSCPSDDPPHYDCTYSPETGEEDSDDNSSGDDAQPFTPREKGKMRMTEDHDAQQTRAGDMNEEGESF